MNERAPGSHRFDRGSARSRRRAALGALLGLGLGAWAAAAGCGARSELYVAEPAEDPADAAADVAPDVPKASSFCAEKGYDSGPTDLSMLVLLDRSGSMLDDNRWASVSAAIAAFVDDPKAEGLGIGLQYYPLSFDCTGDDFAIPAVPIAKIPNNSEAVKASLASVSPYGETPTLPALRGGVEYARGVVLANPKERVVIALVTDGAPNACGSTAEKVAKLAQDAATTDPKVLTYVIGLSTGYTDYMALIASAGGTGKPILVDDGAGAAQTLVNAMLAVKTAQESCTFGVPLPPGVQPKVTDLSVRYRSAPGASPIELPLVADFASCSGAAFYPDDLDAPGSVTLCPAACATVHAADKSEVTVTAGCGMGSDGGPPDASADAGACPTTVDFSCVPACGSNDLTAPACVDGAWTCPPGTLSTEQCTTCPSVPHGCCEDDGTFVIASCVSAAWLCPPGTTLFGSPGCAPPQVCSGTMPCPFDSYCDLPDDSCGKSDRLGTCVAVPASCPPGAPQACGCNGLVYDDPCAAALDGVDLSGNSDCAAPGGTFECGPYFCALGQQICRKTILLGAPVPDQYACLDIPPGCGSGCSCKLCEVCPGNGPCGTCGPNVPGDPNAGVLLQCTQLGP